MAEERQGMSPYNFVQNNPLNRIDPTGMLDESVQGPDDWYKNAKGDLVWFDNTAESFSNDQGNWTNVGANEQEVKQNLNIPEDKSVSWNTLSAVALGGSDRMGNRGGGFGVVTLNNDANISFDLNIEGAEGPLGSTMVDGQTRITGVNVSVNLSSGTGAPGLQLTHIGGNFGLKNWTPMGKINTTSSSSFGPLPYPTLSNNITHASGSATMQIPLSRYRTLSRNFSQSPNLNIGINSTAGFRMQTSPSWNTPTLSPRFFDTSTNVRF